MVNTVSQNATGMVHEPVQHARTARVPAIDAMRGLAILCVVLWQIQLRMPQEHSLLGRVMPPPLFRIVFHSGYYGVILFFVISGFVITRSSITRWGALAEVRGREFLLRRAARLLPGLMVFVLALILFIVLGPFARYVFTYHAQWNAHSYVASLDSIAIACLAGLLSCRVSLARTTRRCLQRIAAAIVVGVFLFREPIAELGLTRFGLDVTLLATGTALLLFALVDSVGIKPSLPPRLATFREEGRVGSNTATRSTARVRTIYMVGGELGAALRWAGRHSYEIYLSHLFSVPFFAKMLRTLPQDAPVGHWRSGALTAVAVLAILGACVLAAVLARYVSVPARRWLLARSAGTLDGPA